MLISAEMNSSPSHEITVTLIGEFAITVTLIGEFA